MIRSDYEICMNGNIRLAIYLGVQNAFIKYVLCEINQCVTDPSYYTGNYYLLFLFLFLDTRLIRKAF